MRHSPDGRTAVVLTYFDAYVFKRGDEESWSSALSRKGTRTKMPLRRQGETVCFGEKGRSLYLLSEGIHQPFWRVHLVRSKH